jgi:hypothetical protein
VEVFCAAVFDRSKESIVLIETNHRTPGRPEAVKTFIEAAKKRHWDREPEVRMLAGRLRGGPLGPPSID